MEGTEGQPGRASDGLEGSRWRACEDDSPFDISSIGIEFSVVIGQPSAPQKMLEGGSANEIAVGTDKLITVIRLLGVRISSRSRCRPAATSAKGPLSGCARPRRSSGAAPALNLVLSGPNLQLLGTGPGIYGTETLAQIHARLEARAREARRGRSPVASRTTKGALRTGSARRRENSTRSSSTPPRRTSLALFDAIKATAIPAVEVHISNPEAREAYRHASKIAPRVRREGLRLRRGELSTRAGRHLRWPRRAAASPADRAAAPS